MKKQTDKPKILVIGTTENSGGAARVSWEVGEGLRKKGYWVKYLVGYKKTNKKHVHELHQSWLLAKLDNLTRFNVVGVFRHLRSLITSNDMRYGAYQEILSNPWYKQADIIHLHNKHGNYLKFNIIKQFAREKKLVWTLHDMWAITSHCAFTGSPNSKDHDPLDCPLSNYPPILLNNRLKLWEKKQKIYQEISDFRIVTPSLWLKNKIKQTILRSMSISLIYNGVDTSVFHPIKQKTAREKLGLPLNKKIILFVAHGGKKDPRKGWESAVRVINHAQLENAIVICVGGGSGSGYIGSTPVQYINYLNSKRELNLYYSASDVLLNTTKAEVCSLVTLETLSSGTPTVSYGAGGVNEIVVSGKHGYVIKSGDEKEMIKKLKITLSTTKAQQSLVRKACRERIVKKFSAKAMINNYANLYQEIYASK